MIVEHALLRIKPDQSAQFEKVMKQARVLIAAQPGFQSIEVLSAAEQEDLYLLLVKWDRIASHRDGFRKSDDYQQWRALLHGFYDPMPDITYFGSSIFDD
ncbi:antibiotic biosynthesis monooxygenase family protein [Parasphingorhabdus sp.]|uniref:antibiotic biosynthesis monooxygenase family protein n=1 Tax=Parasphingorhabdus sp. TaxID=2709688 RepID=UPI003264FA5E